MKLSLIFIVSILYQKNYLGNKQVELNQFVILKAPAKCRGFIVFVGMITGSSNYLADLNAILISKI
jgi:hypothetical protein